MIRQYERRRSIIKNINAVKTVREKGTKKHERARNKIPEKRMRSGNVKSFAGDRFL